MQKSRGRPKKVLDDNEAIEKQNKSHEYYLQFRNKHKDALPEYYKKPNAIIGRPPKPKLEKIDEKPDNKVNDIIENINNLIIELKQNIDNKP
jgi:hypothetical protein